MSLTTSGIADIMAVPAGWTTMELYGGGSLIATVTTTVDETTPGQVIHYGVWDNGASEVTIDQIRLGDGENVKKQDDVASTVVAAYQRVTASVTIVYAGS